MDTKATTKDAWRHQAFAGATALLILLFVYAALSKLLELERFRGQLYNQSFSHALADLLLFALPISELVTCGLLMLPLTRWYGLLSAAALMTVFTLYIALVLLGFWSRVPCSCGGVLAHLSWTQHLWFNLFFLGLSMAGLWLCPDRRR